MEQLSFIPQDYPPPRRLRDLGAESLNTPDLLSVVLGGRHSNEAAKRVMEIWELPELMKLKVEELEQLPDIGPARAAQIIAAVELGQRMARVYMPEKPCISSPADAAAIVMWEMKLLAQESVRVMLLDIRNKLIKIVEVYKGSLNTSTIRVGELFRDAIRLNAASIIIVHNHPSGDPSPSPDDVVVTRLVSEAGKLLDISLYDHIVIGDNRFVSLKERGLGF